MKMNKIICVSLFFIMFLFAGRSAFALKDDSLSAQNQSGEGGQDTQSISDMLGGFSAKHIYVAENSTGRVLFEKNGTEKVSCSHFAKLMTLLITAQKIHGGELSFTDTVVVSEYANSMQGSQIWLDKNEKISVEELVKSISIGNANDACVALAEKVSGSEGEFVKQMNSKAKSLKMSHTHFEDCTGISEKSISTAEDMAKLCAELTKYKEIKGYVTSWSDTVREGKAELVNLNRLVRSYKGISGMKSWGSEKGGNCACVTAKRGNMSVCAVVLGCENNELRDSEARKLLDMSYEHYELFTPEISKEFIEDIPVTGGEKDRIKVECTVPESVVIPKGASYSVEIRSEKDEIITAPQPKDKKVGEMVFMLNDDEIAKVELKTKEAAVQMNVKCGIKKLWLNLLKM